MHTSSHSIQSLTEFRSNPGKVLSRLRRNKKPVLLTQNGKPTAMLIDARKFAKDLSSKQLERLIAEAEADVIAGRMEDFDRFMTRFRDAHNL